MLAPRATGAVAPTSRRTADTMAAHIDTGSGLPVLELGPGTGAITDAILATGLPDERLYAIEANERFCRLLRASHPEVRLHQGDAFDIRATLGDDAPDRFDTVISGLPLLNFPKPMRESLLRQVLDLLPQGRPFVQFSYGVTAPVGVPGGDVRVSKSSWNLKNVPPARVWTYRRA
ncbi:class I SAM-dependent methyltransferase [Oricola sp.]|uniref:class I SAM-dependent methyltransferase n=1 Tax=Oricola sp. TaxID=1979950 RepID=UPI003BA9FCE5